MQVKQQAQFNDNAKVEKVKKKYAVNLEVRVSGFSRTGLDVGRADGRLPDLDLPSRVSAMGVN